VKLPVKYDDIKISQKRMVREAYITEQKGLCYYCKSPLDQAVPTDISEKKIRYELYPSGFFNSRVHLHHSHTTGLTVGAVHCYCNAVLWEHESE